MKVSIAIISAFAAISSVTAFTTPIAASSRSCVVAANSPIPSSLTKLYSSEPEEAEEEGLDLDLEEMFDM